MAIRVPGGCDGFFDPKYGILGPREYLAFLSKGLKYVLPSEFWNYQGPIKYRVHIVHPNVQYMENVFFSFDLKRMQANTPETQCVKWLIDYNKA